MELIEAPVIPTGAERSEAQWRDLFCCFADKKRSLDYGPWASLREAEAGAIVADRQVTAMNPLLGRINIDPEICGGKPCIRGTRLWVSLLLDLLADGMAEAELLAEYPQLVHEDVLAAIAYGAEVARERFVPVPAAGEA